MPFSIETSTPLRQVPADYAPPESERWFTLTEGLNAGLKLFFFDHVTGAGPPEQTVLFVHGNPECSYTYRHVWQELVRSKRSLRIVAMDHVGFGLSDQATFEMVDMHHAANLRQLVRHLDLRDVTLVVHDWGGPIGIGAFLDEPERVAGLVVLNTTVFPMPATGFTYKNFPYPWLAWCWTPFLIPNRLWGGVASYVVGHAEPQSTGQFLRGLGAHLVRYARRRHSPGSPDAVFSEQFRSKANAEASKRHVRQTPSWGYGYRYDDSTHGPQDNTTFYRRLQSMVAQDWGPSGRSIPAAGFFGGWDACGKEEVIAQWHAALPQMASRSRIFPEHGHFIEEHRGADIAAGILELRG